MTDILDLEKVPHHPVIEEMVDVLCNKTQNIDRGFFRVEASYFLAKMAASMRAMILTKDRGEVPVNIYALALATSGFGKGHSVNIVEHDFLGPFKKRFMEDTFEVMSDTNLWKLAVERAAISGLEEDKEKEAIDKEFRQAGAMVFTFDSGTTPAVKQLRQKLLMANAGSINLQIDEIGSNLLSSTEVLNVFLELYDQGMVKQKLTKNTADNMRGRELDGKTPTNALLFGTPMKLLDGGQTEDQFYGFLETGYARRCLFAWGEPRQDGEDLDPAEIYHRLIDKGNTQTINRLANHFALLADHTKFGWQMTVEDEVGITLLTYKLRCEAEAKTFAEHEEIRKAELSHRYFKALKLAGALAFVDESSEVTMDHLLSAIKIVEESGEAFKKLLTREKPYVKLAKYISSCKEDQTHADLHEALPFYKSSKQARDEMMTLAMAWGYKQHIVIKKTFVDGIEFFSGDTLTETDLNEITLSYSDHFAYNYAMETPPFDKLHILTQQPGLHWCNHGFRNGHRKEENVVPGFNMVVVDCDGDVPLSTAQDLMKDFVYMTYTTKRHTPEVNRFRMIFPINYHLELDQEDYREFMNQFMAWLPFPSDEGANQRSKKWETFDGGTYNLHMDGELVDALRFIPKTSKNEQYRNAQAQVENLDNLERWFALRMAEGNRNNNMIKFALALVDSGCAFNEVETMVLAFNNKLSNPLSEDEIRSTILQTVAKKIS